MSDSSLPSHSFFNVQFTILNLLVASSQSQPVTLIDVEWKVECGSGARDAKPIEHASTKAVKYWALPLPPPHPITSPPPLLEQARHPRSQSPSIILRIASSCPVSTNWLIPTLCKTWSRRAGTVVLRTPYHATCVPGGTIIAQSLLLAYEGFPNTTARGGSLLFGSHSPTFKKKILSRSSCIFPTIYFVSIVYDRSILWGDPSSI